MFTTEEEQSSRDYCHIITLHWLSAKYIAEEVGFGAQGLNSGAVLSRVQLQTEYTSFEHALGHGNTIATGHILQAINVSWYEPRLVSAQSSILGENQADESKH